MGATIFKRHKIKFLREFFINEMPFLPHFRKISYIQNGTREYQQDFSENHLDEDYGVFQITLVPDFCSFQLHQEDDYIKRSLVHDHGFQINLNKIESIDAYLKQQFKRNAKTIKRYVRRLESCFDIEYRLFYGEIPKEQYDYILSSLKNMILRRFEQRNEDSEQLDEWDFIESNTYGLIKKKKASLFVIYERETPIEISINYHIDKILYSYVSSYDIDYSKFGLGHVEIYKQLEWCLENGYGIFEMGWGTMDYKRRWSNHSYDYQKYFYCKKKSFLDSCHLKIMLLLENIKSFLVKKKIHLVVKKLKKKFNTKQQSVSDRSLIQIEDTDLEIDNYNEVDLSEASLLRIKKYICDFLYTSGDHISDIKAYKSKREDISYIIQGKNRCQKISVIQQ